MAADFAQERRWKEAAAKKVWLKWNNSETNVKLHISTTKGQVPTDVLLKLSRVSAAARSHMCPLPSRPEEK